MVSHFHFPYPVSYAMNQMALWHMHMFTQSTASMHNISYIEHCAWIAPFINMFIKAEQAQLWSNTYYCMSKSEQVL